MTIRSCVACGETPEYDQDWHGDPDGERCFTSTFNEDGECVDCYWYNLYDANLYQCHHCSRDFCWECWDDGEECEWCYIPNARVQNYYYRPDRGFVPKGDSDRPMFGVELEVGVEDRYGSSNGVIDVVCAIDPRAEHLYMKEDNSIEGVEIVTHPMTLEWARQYKFDEMLRRLRSNGCCVDEDYGLHVHVSRAAFRQRSSANRRRGSQSQHHQMMWLMFLYRNADPLKRLARRDSSQWASFRSPRPGELKRKAQGPDQDERYVAVNCNNRYTYELRFFESTLNAEEFWAALEFADASVKYTRNLSSSEVLKGGGLSWDRFTDWCSEHDYTNLHAQILKTN